MPGPVLASCLTNAAVVCAGPVHCIVSYSDDALGLLPNIARYKPTSGFGQQRHQNPLAQQQRPLLQGHAATAHAVWRAWTGVPAPKPELPTGSNVFHILQKAKAWLHTLDRAKATYDSPPYHERALRLSRPKAMDVVHISTRVRGRSISPTDCTLSGPEAVDVAHVQQQAESASRTS